MPRFYFTQSTVDKAPNARGLDTPQDQRIPRARSTMPPSRAVYMYINGVSAPGEDKYVALETHVTALVRQ